MEFLDHPNILIVVGILSIPVYGALAKIFYGDKFENLEDAIKYVIWPDWYSLIRGKFWQDWDATIKLYIFIGLCTGWVCATSEFLVRHVI